QVLAIAPAEPFRLSASDCSGSLPGRLGKKRRSTSARHTRDPLSFAWPRCRRDREIRDTARNKSIARLLNFARGTHGARNRGRVLHWVSTRFSRHQDGSPMTGTYREDLAYIHDAGYGGMARAAAPVLIAELRAQGHERGRVIDLGCGSGILAAAVAKAGYD